MGLLLKLGIGLILGLIAFMQYPEQTSDIFEKGKGLVENVLDNETVSDNSTIESNSTLELEKLYLGKITTIIDIDCELDLQCQEVYGENVICEGGSCYQIV